MKSTILTVVGASALAALAMGCSKDQGQADGDKAGVSARSASESGPQRTAKAVEPNEISITSKSTEAVELFRQARDLHENFRTSLAQKKLEKAIELDPKFALAHAYLAMTHVGDERKAAIATAVQLAEKVPLAEKLVIKGFEQQCAGDRDAAMKAHAKLAEQAPGDWRAHYWVGLDHQAKGDVDKAAKSLELAIKLNPKAAAPYNNLAYLYANEGKFDQAIDAVESYVSLKPGEPNPLDSKAEILMKAGKLDQAERSFAKAASMSSDFYIANTGLAAARMHRGDWRGGIEALNAYVAAAQQPWEAKNGRTELAWAKLGADDLEGAIAMTEAIARAGKDGADEGGQAMAHYLAAQLYVEAGEFVKASRAAELALAGKDAPEWIAPWANLVKFRAALGAGKLDKADQALANIDASVASMEKEGKKDGGETVMAYARGALALEKGQADQAVEHFSNMKDGGPLAYRGRWMQAKALAVAGKKGEAEKLRKELASTYSRRAADAYFRARFLGSGEI